MRDLSLIQLRASFVGRGRSFGFFLVLVSLVAPLMADEPATLVPQPRRRTVVEMPMPAVSEVRPQAESPATRSVDGIPDLTFRDLFRASSGASGLEYTERATALAGKPVRLHGYMVRQTQPIPWAFILSPVPQSLHEREYGECDDLPVTAIHVFLPRSSPPIPARHNGQVTVTGVLELGGHEEADGRVSPARIRITGSVATGLVASTASQRASTTNR